VDASEQQALVAQVGGRSHLVGIRQDDCRGKIEQVYANKDTESQTSSNYEFGAIFTSRGRAVLFGTVEGCVLVWDKSHGDIVYGLDHGKGISFAYTLSHHALSRCLAEDTIQAVAVSKNKPPVLYLLNLEQNFDGSHAINDGHIITGTKRGQLTWWSQPPLECE
jgi:hypothetical protein